MSLLNTSRNAFIWASFQQIGVVVLNLFISILLARILNPEEFGLIGMLSIFIAVGNVLMSGGMGVSIIRTQNPTHRELSTVFFFNLAFSVICYLFIIFISPFIADFFERAILEKLIKVYSIVLVIFAFSAVQYSQLTQALKFKLALSIKLPSIIIGGIIGLSMAYYKYGVWSLIGMYIAQALADAIQLWFRSGWTPSLLFNMEDFKKHFSFGYKISLVGILNAVYNNIYNLIIGKNFSAQTLGYYTRSYTLSQMPVANLQEIITKVTFPLMASIQEDDDRLKKVYRKINRATMLIIFPVMLLSIIIAEPLFRFFLTSKWIPAVPYFQLICVTGLFLPLSGNNLTILKVKGKSGLVLKLGIIEKSVISIGLFGAVFFGVIGLLYFQILVSFLAFVFNSYMGGRIIHYGPKNQLKDFLHILFFSSITSAITYFIYESLLQKANDLFTIVLLSMVYFTIYLGIIYLIDKSILNDFKDLFKKRKE